MNSRSIYRIYEEVEGCSTYGFDAYNEIDYLDVYAEYFKGKPLPKNWKMPKYSLGSPREPLHDFVYGGFVAPVVSDRAKKALEPIIGDAVQFWPAGKIKGQDYYIFNVICVVDCLDLNKSEISYSPSAPERILNIRKAFFDQRRIPEDVVVFKIPQDPCPIYVTDIFVDCVRKHQLTGVGFEWPHDIGAARPKNVFPDLPIKEFVNNEQQIRRIHKELR